MPGGQWKKGPRGLRWEYARKEPDEWKAPKKRLHFIKSPAPPSEEDKENPTNVSANDAQQPYRHHQQHHTSRWPLNRFAFKRFAPATMRSMACHRAPTV